MAEFDDNILRDEENYGGFEPGDPDDDTFLLTDAEKYPGNLNEFMFIKPEKYANGVDENEIEKVSDPTQFNTSAEESAKKVESNKGGAAGIAELVDDPDEGSVWDAFDSEELDMLDSMPKPKSATVESEPDETDLIFEQINQETEPEPDFQEEESAEEEIQPGKDYDVEPTEESDELGELKNFLQGELAKSRAQKSEKDIAEKFEKVQQTPIEPIPDDDLKSAKTIDLSKFELDKPSTAGLQKAEDKMKESIEEPDGPSILDDELSKLFASSETIGGVSGAQVIKDDEKKSKKKKKNRKKFLLLPAAILLVAFAAVGVAGYYLYKNHIDPVKSITSIFSKKETATENVKKDEHKDVADDAEKHEQKSEVKNDSAKTTAEVAKTASPDTSHLITEKPETHQTEPEHKEVPQKENLKQTAHASEMHDANATEELKRDALKRRMENENQAKKLEPEHDRINIEKNKKTEQKVEPEHKKVVASTSKENSEKKTSVENKTERSKVKDTKASDIASIVTPQQKLPEVKNTDEANAVYTVQIYASPSESDAKEWLNVLKTKNIEGVYISPQKIRDQIWYRVRFGTFNSREEARRAALRLGFNQTWIDRVK